ncbi:unnamed protein product [Tilletia controversa]|uniref:SART-1 protein n=3 Tax=Tilletia TaxID=13289 RepID=A0A8X7MVX9_9BASI|nr:hypothetical protein CF336_g2936 [Tilletia laevis]KAE8201282.1 hypothetical protein CF328_g2716 [Tilletia controversa]KAE8262707.1 hypothetical protein A4X03_0g2245 [Tilletia caries]KAE8205479.1 hypothetical protein CF335_g2285 [Tilletia laevis]KAE8249249.1 hypothetical protein A4X06_0g3324 [Tilletia controversa]
MPTEVTREELEELNAQRIKLGLKPLEVETVDSKTDGGAAASEDPDAVAEANFARVRDEARKEREDKALDERIAKAKNKRELARKLAGKGLGEAADDRGGDSKPESALAWLKASKKRAKENAARRLQQQIEEQEAQVQAEYGQDDLAGLRIGHDYDEFEEEGEERILTLRDARVLEDVEDELVDHALAQREQDALKDERRKGAKKYTGLDDEEFGEGVGPSSSVVGKKRGVLSKYDGDLGEEDPLTKSGGEVGFRIGGPKRNKEEIKAQEAEEAARLANRKLLNLDYAKNVEVSDYLTEGEVGFKKSKGKKKKRTATRVIVDLDDEAEPDQAAAATTNGGDAIMAEQESTSMASGSRQRLVETDNFVDDDDLQASLAKARRQKAKKTLNKLTPEQIAANLASQRATEDEESRKDVEAKMEVDDSGDGEQPLTFDSTTEFVRNLAFKAAAEEPRRQIKSEPSDTIATLPQEPGPSEVVRSSVKVEEQQAAPPSEEPSKKTQDGHDDEMDVSEDEDFENLEVFAVPAEGAGEGEGEDGAVDQAESSSEPLAGGSMAATVSLLRQQGLLQEYTPELKQKEAKQREYDLWMAERRRRERVREEELAASKARGSAVDQATREYENQQRDLADAREAQKRFANYKPDVELKYHDQYGRELSQKKAWKVLSHRFHGKAPGHKKQELELRRLENERKREKMESGDTPTGMSKAFQDRSERTGQAHMVLSVGARGNAPQELSMLGPDITKSARPPPAAAVGNNGTSKGKGKGKASSRHPDMSSSISSIGLQSFVPRHVGGGSGLASVLPSSKRNGSTGSGTPLPPSGAAPSAPPPPPQSSSDTAGNGGAMLPPPAVRPVMKPAFAPIKRAAAASTPIGHGTDAGSATAAAPAPAGAADGAGRFKLQLGSKRKAEEPATGSEPQGKRRG